MTDPVVPAVAPKPVVATVAAPAPVPAPVVAAKAPDAKEEPKADLKAEDAPEPKGKTAAARLDALEARLAYLTALYGWPTEEHDEKLAEKAKAEQVDFAGNPVKAA